LNAEWVQAEVELLKEQFPELECRDDGWCRLAHYALPEGWSEPEVALAFRIPHGLPGEVPYAFWTKPSVTLEGGAPPDRTSGPVETGFGPGWQQWSWQAESWHPGPSPREGNNMTDHVRSIAHRFQELS
jgi:hypothetical protein